MKNDLFYIPAVPPDNSEGINERRMAQAANVRDNAEPKASSPPIHFDPRKNAPPVTRRRQFGQGPMNANVRRRRP